MFKRPVPTSKKEQPIRITGINWLTLFKEIITLCSENNTEPRYTLCGKNAELFTVKAGGTYSYH
jgi:hypothetical protein